MITITPGPSEAVLYIEINLPPAASVSAFAASTRQLRVQSSQFDPKRLLQNSMARAVSVYLTVQGQLV
jgi:hypothetical protein